MCFGLKVFLIAFVVIFGIALFVRLLKKGGGKAFLLGALQGIAALFAVNITQSLTGVGLSVNWWSIGTSAAVGLPGVVGMLVLDIILK